MTTSVDMEQYLDLSDLSDKEDAEQIDLSPFVVNWLDLGVSNIKTKLGISSLPGSKYKKCWRSLPFDIKCLKEAGIEDIFCLCTKGEFHLYRVEDLLEKYTEAGFTVHHHPIEDGQAPPTDTMLSILADIKAVVTSNKKALIHCYGGVGRSCLVAMCLLLSLDETLSIEEARDQVKQLRGERAMGSVKQYNFANEFREILEARKKKNCQAEKDSRCASR